MSFRTFIHYHTLVRCIGAKRRRAMEQLTIDTMTCVTHNQHNQHNHRRQSYTNT